MCAGDVSRYLECFNECVWFGVNDVKVHVGLASSGITNEVVWFAIIGLLAWQGNSL